MSDISRADATRLLNFALRRRDSRVGRGECYDLADQALASIAARSAPDYGEITPDADYAWGREVPTTELLPGDVIQFRNYRVTVRTTTDVAGGDNNWTEAEQERPHHTAILIATGEHGRMSVYEQNVENVRRVRSSELYWISSEFVESRNTTPAGTTTVTKNVTVTGTLTFYRPQTRS